MWLINTDRQEADQHDRHARSTARMLLPMLDITGLVERTPEAQRRRVAEHERFALAIAQHELRVVESVPSVMQRLAAWIELHLIGAFRQPVSADVASRR